MIKRARLLAHIGAVLALLAAPALAGTISGQISAPNTSVLAKNYTISFNLSQAAFKGGSFLVTASTVNCYTDAAGNVVGLPNPLVAPAFSLGSGGAGTLPNGTYYLEITYYNGSSETVVSPEQTISLSGANDAINVTVPTLQPANATGFRVYASITSGAETLQASQPFASGPLTINSLVAGVSPPASNSSICSLSFNDELIPTGTTYSVNMTNANGRQVAGFPQQWYLPGGSAGTINVSNGYPISQNVAVFQTPIWANPVNNVQQSINGPLNMNGYAINNTSFSNATFAEPKINTGIQNNGTGFQHKRFGASCTTAASAGASCTGTLTWATPFADANYTVACSVSAATGIPVFLFGTKTASNMPYSISSVTAVATQASEIDCVATHD